MKEDKAAILAEVAAALSDKQFVAASDILRDQYPFTRWSKTPRRNSPEKMIKVFAKDGFVDRYSGARLIFPAALQLISKLVPDAFPYHRNWKTSACHSAYWELCATIDHLEPVGLEGADEESNWYTTSMVHNASKSLYTLRELGWLLHAPGDIREWDGLTGWFLERAKEVLEHGKELCWNLGDGVDQAADISWFATSIPSRNFTPRTIFGN
jgi:hypothetical protein